MKFQSSAKRGRFSVPNQGDLGIKAFSQQQERILKFLEIERRQHKEQGEQYIAGLKGVASNEAENARILQKLKDDIYRTRYQAVDTKGKRDVDAAKGIAKELEKEQQHWEKWTKTGGEVYGKLIQSVGAYSDYLDFKDWKDDYEQSGGLAAFIQANEGLIRIENGKIITDEEKLLNLGGEENSELAQALADIRQSANPRRAEYLKSIFIDNQEQWLINANNELLALVEENNQDPNKQKISALELAPSFYKEYAENLIESSGVKLNTKSAQEIVTRFTNAGGLQQLAISRKNKFEKNKEQIGKDLRSIFASSLDFTIPENVTDFKQKFLALVNTNQQGWTETKSGAHFKVNVSRPQAIENALALVAAQPNTTREHLNAIYDIILDKSDAGHKQESIRERYAYSGLTTRIDKIFADKVNAQKSSNQADTVQGDNDRLKQLQKELNVTGDARKGIYNSNGNLTQEAAAKYALEYRAAEAAGHTESMKYLRGKLTYNPKLQASIVQQATLVRYAAENNLDGFNSIFYNLSAADQQKLGYLQKGFEGITLEVRQEMKTAIKAQATKSAGVFKSSRTPSLTVNKVVPFAQVQVDSEYQRLLKLRDSGDPKYKDLSNLELYREAGATVIQNIADGVGVYELETPRTTDGADSTHFKHFLYLPDTSKDLTNKELNDILPKITSLDDLRTYLTKDISISREGREVSDGRILGSSTMAALIKDVQDGNGIQSLPEVVKTLAAHLNTTPEEILNTILRESGTTTRYTGKIVPKSPNTLAGENAQKSGGDPNKFKGKSSSYCSAALLTNQYTERFGGVPLSQNQKANFALNKVKSKGNKEIFAAFEAKGLKVGRDYYVNEERWPGRPWMGNMKVIVPTTDAGYRELFRTYKELGLKILPKYSTVVTTDGKLINVMNCTFVNKD